MNSREGSTYFRVQGDAQERRRVMCPWTEEAVFSHVSRLGPFVLSLRL